MNKLFLVISALAILSCNKKKDTTIPFSEATYTMTVSLNWTSPQFGVPGGAHVTPLIGMIHSKDTFQWKTGILATAGLELVAEQGVNTIMDTELDAIIASGKALSKFTFTQPAITGTVINTITLNTNYPLISFASMLAPTPDWFIGLNSFSLLDNNSQWISDITIDLYSYDAGSEDGDVFSTGYPDSSPHGNVAILTPANASILANGNASVGPIGTIRFVKN